MAYLCAIFSRPRPLCSRLRPDVRDRQTDVGRHTDVRRASSFNASALWGRGHNRQLCNFGQNPRPEVFFITPHPGLGTSASSVDWCFVYELINSLIGLCQVSV